jgi:integrase
MAQAKADTFHAVATGEKVLIAEHIDPWLEASDFSPRTKDAAHRDAVAFAKWFPSVDDITKPVIQDLVYEMAKSVARGTVQKRMSSIRSLWKYLQRNKLAPAESEPFLNLDIPKAPKNGNGKRRPFTRDDINKLLANSDGVMRATITLAAYTGARFSELTSLRVDDVTEETFRIQDGKTAAAEREIPIHSAIKPLVAQLKAESKDGWLIEGGGLATNNLGERGRTLGKAFGLFKTELGYDDRFVFHSIRKTVATMFEEAGVQEVIAARILGHALKTMSYGLYSGGVDLETKRAAMEKALTY